MKIYDAKRLWLNIVGFPVIWAVWIYGYNTGLIQIKHWTMITFLAVTSVLFCAELKASLTKAGYDRARARKERYKMARAAALGRFAEIEPAVTALLFIAAVLVVFLAGEMYLLTIIAVATFGLYWFIVWLLVLIKLWQLGRK